MSKKPRVYLSKSKQVDLDTLLLTRKLLSAYNIELVEVFEGDYGHDILGSCDIVLVLPPIHPNDIHGFSFSVGVSQYDEIVISCEDIDIPVHCILYIDEELSVSEYSGIDIIGDDSDPDFAIVECVDYLNSLTDIHAYFELLPTITKTGVYTKQQSFNTNLLLLCK